MRQTYDIAGEVFTSKGAILQRSRGILHRQPLLPAGVPEEDEPFLRALLMRHPEAQTKVGCGIKRIFVNHDAFGGRCFWVERLDGTKTDWSIKSCLHPPTHRNEVIGALRWLAHPQILSFRNRAFGGRARMPCAITGKLVTVEESHIDHRPPHTFVELVRLFMEERGLTWEDIKVVSTTDGRTFDTLADVMLAFAWVSFHQKHAVLQVTDAVANLKQEAERVAQLRVAGQS